MFLVTILSLLSFWPIHHSRFDSHHTLLSLALQTVLSGWSHHNVWFGCARLIQMHHAECSDCANSTTVVLGATHHQYSSQVSYQLSSNELQCEHHHPIFFAHSSTSDQLKAELPLEPRSFFIIDTVTLNSSWTHSPKIQTVNVLVSKASPLWLVRGTTKGH